ncbi:unnamed protein product [Adineta ricciae]|uniref:WH1 domain-containing protein n=1 Tax=Adineta ricciae TaxID=249248 RepID=A0A813TNT0_ADIRI|nr:unnamed protein product [Adineta ricciae]
MHLNTNMGVQAPLYTCKAIIFQVDPETRRSWNQLSTGAVNVQIFYDSIKNVHRIISVDGSKILINTVITSRMNFIKTSEKFCQWMDSKANQVYGLGFANEFELTRFINKFTTIKEASRNTVRSHSLNVRRISRSETDWSTKSSGSDRSMHLKQENAHLKLALVQSSNNAKVWQEELEILRSNNTKLTTALQESHANVEEWKRQLQFYREECSRLRQMICTPHSSDHEQVSDAKETKNRLGDIEFHNKQQEQKISQLESQIQRYTTQINSLKDRLSRSETVNQDLRSELQQRTVSNSASSRTPSRSPHRNLQQLSRLRDLFETKTNDFNQTMSAQCQDLQRLCSQITQVISEF